MGIKEFMTCFIFTAFFLFVFCIPTFLKAPTARIHPTEFEGIRQAGPPLPTFAYLISASKGDVDRLKRTLRALYHPVNHYLLHLDLEASATERRLLSEFVSNDPVFAKVGNVRIVGKPNLVTYRGPTMLSTTLHALSMLLRSRKWDWFINLSASDYPLITQDDLISAFSNLSRDLSFIHHTSNLGWKVNRMAKPVIIDPGLYTRKKSKIVQTTEQRDLPTAFKLYSGSAWTVLSRAFAEFCILGWDNLPRTLLLYYTNFISSPEGYFQTVICNSKDFRNTTVNHDLHYIAWDTPPKQHPISLGLKDYRRMIFSNAPFARKFKRNDPVLDKIDRELLHRHRGKFAYGGWCSPNGEIDKPCSELGTGEIFLKPGSGSRRLKALLTKFLSKGNFINRQCR